MRTRLMAAPLVGLAVLFAACSSSGGASPTAAPATQAPATQAPATEAPATEAPSASAATVDLGDNALGAILVDASGKTLYVFVPDKGGDSTCYDDCAKAWPPLTITGSPTAGEGLGATDLGTTTRTDGSTQVTFKGWPLYYFQGDQAAGDTNGQGLNDVWWVVGADGTMIGAPAASGGASGGASVAIADNALGAIAVDGNGMTLYVFKPDNAGDSTCYDDCAKAWPPLLTDGDPVAGEGIDAEDLGTTERTDGKTQVTFYGWPLYSFQGDKAAGDTNGQGLNDVWWVVDAEGTMVGAPAS